MLVEFAIFIPPQSYLTLLVKEATVFPTGSIPFSWDYQVKFILASRFPNLSTIGEIFVMLCIYFIFDNLFFAVRKTSLTYVKFVAKDSQLHMRYEDTLVKSTKRKEITNVKFVVKHSVYHMMYEDTFFESTKKSKMMKKTFQKTTKRKKPKPLENSIVATTIQN